MADELDLGGRHARRYQHVLQRPDTAHDLDGREAHRGVSEGGDHDNRSMDHDGTPGTGLVGNGPHDLGPARGSISVVAGTRVCCLQSVGAHAKETFGERSQPCRCMR